MGHFLQAFEATCRLSAMTSSFAALGEIIQRPMLQRPPGGEGSIGGAEKT